MSTPAPSSRSPRRQGPAGGPRRGARTGPGVPADRGAARSPAGRAGFPPDLPGDWAGELRVTARAGEAERAGGLIVEGMEAFAAGDFEASARLAEQAKALAPRSARVRELLGLARYRAGQWQEALRELLTFRRLTGSVLQNHLIADCYRALGRPERALEVCGEVLPEQVGEEVWAELVIVAASALADQGLPERGLASLGRIDLEPNEVKPHHLRLWYVRADLLERMGRAVEARRAWERIAAEDPEFFDVAERLAGGPR